MPRGWSYSATHGNVTRPSYRQVGEIDANLQGLLASQQGITTPFAVHADSAPFIYLDNQPPRSDATVRTFERGIAKLTAPNPYLGRSVKLTNYLADPVELKALHMITANPARTPTVAMFANPDYYLYASRTPCSGAKCEGYDSEVWNHGDVSPDINQSWMAFVGPGVENLGVDNTWASETDTRPTLMALLGLVDDYIHEGRVLTELIKPTRLSPTLADPDYAQLGNLYTQLESPVGPFGLDTLTASTRGLASGTSNSDGACQRTETAIAALGAERDSIGTVIHLLEGAAFSAERIPHSLAERLVEQGDDISAEQESSD